VKDQSYFLYGIPRDRLHRIVFPLGDRTKDETRRRAAELGLEVAGRAESAELCFAGQGDYRAALGDSPDAGPGDVLDNDGRVIGRHEGIARYTIGQRSGLGIAGGVPLYVIRIDADANTITLGDRAAAASRTVAAGQLNVLAPRLLATGGRLFGKIRSRTQGEPCEVVEATPGRLVVRFDEPEHGVTPGQHLVLYTQAGRIVVGGEISQ
jgi:tRNA-specific 2-thiouridylase